MTKPKVKAIPEGTQAMQKTVPQKPSKPTIAKNTICLWSCGDESH